MKNNTRKQVHASCVSQDGAGILIRGLSGTGKSDLALRLIKDGAQLVADDQVFLQVQNGRIFACAPEPLYGLLEVRGIGIIRMLPQVSAPIRLVVDLTQNDEIERLPTTKTTNLRGVIFPKINLWAFETSAVAKVRIALDLALSRMIGNYD